MHVFAIMLFVASELWKLEYEAVISVDKDIYYVCTFCPTFGVLMYVRRSSRDKLRPHY